MHPLPLPARAMAAITLALGLVGGVVAGAVPAAAATDGSRPGTACSRGDTSGTSFVDVTHDGVRYPVRVHVPAGVSPYRPLPLVLNLHGSSNNSDLQMQISGLAEVAEEERFVVAAPNGAIPMAPNGSADGSWAWNVPGVPTTAGAFPPEGARDDVAFLAAVIDTVSAQLCTDRTRTYATGFSGGGRMASTLACRIPDRIAAIAPVGGLRAGRPDPQDVTVPEPADCRPDRAVPVVTFHGTGDLVNPYAGNGDLRWGYGVELAARTWGQLDDCRRGPGTQTVSEHVTLTTYTGCDRRAEVHLYTTAGDGHTWPGSDLPLEAFGLGHQTDEIDASTLMWDFFEKHRAPRR